MSPEASVRTVRQHLAPDGMKMPGDEYSRPADEAAELELQGVLEVLGTAKAAPQDAPEKPGIVAKRRAANKRARIFPTE